MEKITKRDSLRREMKKELRNLRRQKKTIGDNEQVALVEEEIKATIDLLGELK